MNKDPGKALIAALQIPALYGHPVERFQVLETHISWVLLTGPFAYKIKKPVNLGFLDFSTLDKRRHCCEEELRLNRRLAPTLYLEVVTITGDAQQPTLNGSGPVIEYAVKMREFPQAAQLDRVLARGELHEHHIAHLAQQVANFHTKATVAAPDTPYGNTESVWHPVAQNFEHIRPHLETNSDKERLERLLAWSERSHSRLMETWVARKRDGFIRECHGDMHLGNMALMGDDILIFDCIEFNENLRWIDVMSEVAFVTMDLYDRDRPGLAHRFLNDYLQHSNDYAGLSVLRFYQVYRALVRAKVACIRLAQSGLSTSEREEIHAHYRRYLQLAERYTQTSPTPLIITHGLSGSGKTTVSNALLESSGAIRVRSDVERKRLYGLPAEARSDSALDADLYSSEATARTYQKLANLARTIITSSFPAIVDGAFLREQQRKQFHGLAEGLHVPFVIFHCTASPEILQQRVEQRAELGRDASEADLKVLKHQLETQEPLLPDEAEQIFTVDTGTV